ncbi:MAG: FAD-dependent monooxygenase [Chroococcidiopsidaceae cyanobacterium CP_BM_ER_R8_30]|nr:FAD-dependent monooxygenase [Chroococcidiopsidaceae cyanobacterium CP_BM_ER_R8_30]
MNTQTLSPSYFSTPNTGRHAVVIGGSMAGLLAARVLTDYFEQVTIIDRDTFPDLPDHRKGVPQSHHAHALLARGQEIIDRLFPGIMDELRAEGALSACGVVPVAFVTPKGALPLLKQDEEFLAFSRFLLEWHVRRRLTTQTSVRCLTNCEVTGLLSTPERTQVIGVRLHHRDEDADSTHSVAADLVVDASGRHSKAPEWLVRLGYSAPPEETINSGIGYASRFYAKPSNFPADWQGIIINNRPPHNPRAGLILPIEHGRWHVTLGGFAGNYPPTDESGFLQWARDLADPSLFEAIRIAEPISPIRGYRTPQNRLRHFERLDRWPIGFIATGDSVCAFNPIYGQGMTTSALDALVLADCLSQQQRSPKPGFERRFQKQLAKTIAAPWLIATAEDLRWRSQGVTLSGARPRIGLGFLHGYMNLVLQQACEDTTVTRAYINVLGMTAPPQSLMQPHILLRVLSGALKSINESDVGAGERKTIFILRYLNGARRLALYLKVSTETQVAPRRKVPRSHLLMNCDQPRN